MRQFALAFDVFKYNRDELNQLTDQELYNLWVKESDDEAIKIYTLDELSEAWNDDELDTDGTWMYIVRL